MLIYNLNINYFFFGNLSFGAFVVSGSIGSGCNTGLPAFSSSILIGFGAAVPGFLPLFAVFFSGKGFKSDNFGVDGAFSDDFGKGFKFVLVGVPICNCTCCSPVCALMLLVLTPSCC